MTHPSIVADTLDAAADLIEQKGWTQHVYARGPDGEEVEFGNNAACYCALGAISVASGGEPADELGFNAQAALGDLLVPNGYFGWRRIPDWNDAPERTKAEVVSALREAAAKARGEVQP